VKGGLPSTEASADCNLRLFHPSAFRNHIIECGDIDGVVLGSWENAKASSLEVDDDSSHAGYWAAAAVWSNAWDQKTIDRVSKFFIQTYLLPRTSELYETFTLK